MPASARLKVITEFLTPADPQDFTNRTRPKVLKATDANQYSQQFVIANPSDAIVIASFSLPLAQNETSRTYTQVTGTAVTGITASGSGAVGGTYTLPVRSSVTTTIVSTFAAPTVLVDRDGRSVAKASSAPIARYTETTVGGVTVSPQVEVEVPLRPVNLGTGPFLFAYRNPDADTVLRGLVSGMTDAEFVRLSGWMEEGNDLWDLVKRPTADLAASVPAGASASSTEEWTVMVARSAQTVTAASIIPSATITGQASNYVTLSLRNRGPAGAGTATIADLAFSSGAVVATANVEKPLTLSGTPANLAVNPGDVITLSRLVTGTGLATPSLSAVIRSRPLG